MRRAGWIALATAGLLWAELGVQPQPDAGVVRAEPGALRVGPAAAGEPVAARFVVESGTPGALRVHGVGIELHASCERIFTSDPGCAFEVTVRGIVGDDLRVGANQRAVEVAVGDATVRLPLAVERALGDEIVGARIASMGFVPAALAGVAEVVFRAPWDPARPSTPVTLQGLDGAPLATEWYRAEGGRTGLRLTLAADARPGYYGGSLAVPLGAGVLVVPVEAMKDG